MVSWRLEHWRPCSSQGLRFSPPVVPHAVLESPAFLNDLLMSVGPAQLLALCRCWAHLVPRAARDTSGSVWVLGARPEPQRERVGLGLAAWLYPLTASPLLTLGGEWLLCLVITSLILAIRSSSGLLR